MLKRSLVIIILCIPVSVWAFIKPVRTIVPELNGVTCVSPQVCIDDKTRIEEANALYMQGLDFVESTISDIKDEPRIIFCSTAKCSDSFGLGERAAFTLGEFGIVVSPRGWKPYYVRHELIHHAQYENLGLFRVLLTTPAWFTEGMAYYLSGDPRPILAEPFEGYREKFKSWYSRVNHDDLWSAAESL